MLALWIQKQNNQIMFNNKETLAIAKCITHNETHICGFFCDYRWLSNFYPCPIVMEGIEYASVEHAYQAMKWLPEFLDASKLNAMTPNKVKDAWKTVPKHQLVPEHTWLEIRTFKMWNCLIQKYTTPVNHKLKTKLLATGTKHLEETNYWGDTFWGTDQKHKGSNILGILTMALRKQLLSPKTTF